MSMFLVVIVTAWLMVQPQDAPGSKRDMGASKVRIGMSQAEVRKIMGEPDSYFYSDRYSSHYVLRSERAAAERVYGELDDIYNRKTASNEFEILVRYGFDDRASRLHPTLRVSSIRFTADKPKPFRLLLDDIAEAKDLCVRGCRAKGVFDGVSPKIQLFPTADELADHDLATRAASGFREEQSRFSFSLGIECTWRWESAGYSYPPKAPAIDWDSAKVEKVWIRPEIEDFDKDMDARFPVVSAGHIFADLEQWRGDDLAKPPDQQR